MDATSPFISSLDQFEIAIDVDCTDDKELEMSDDLDDYSSEVHHALECYDSIKKPFNTVNHGFERIHQNEPAPPPEGH